MAREGGGVPQRRPRQAGWPVGSEVQSPQQAWDSTERGQAGVPRAQTGSSGAADLNLPAQALSASGLP